MNFDIVVIGGGHAGVEAATVAARMNNQTCLITMSENDIGQLSCNPAIGGIGKGHLVREIDVFGGMIGKLADQSCIHFKMLNATKGEAVQGGRMQIDRELYQKASRHAIQNHKNLSCVFDEVIDIETHDNYLSIIAQTKTITAKKVIITTGTFLGGKLFLGDKTIEGGRLNDKPSNLLAQTITKTHKTLRLNTGTPPRIYHDTINYENLEQQLEDEIIIPFSLSTQKINNPQIKCYITYTNEKTHQCIHKILSENKNYNTCEEEVKGPRYCPSIETKIIRFPNKDRHRIFLEPEGLTSNIIYPNGIANSFSLEFQQKMINTIPGLENAKIQATGYSVEYVCIDTKEIQHTLESKHIKGLFFAGQINGTTGYEEAAAQGLIAGINAALQIKNPEAKFILPRESSYIGVLIDDIINKTRNLILSMEPYRIFSSRVENRLSIRFDNALTRLANYANSINLLSSEYKTIYLINQKHKNQLTHITNQIKIRINDSVVKPLRDLLRMPQLLIENIEYLMHNTDLSDISYNTWIEFLADIKYSGYKTRHNHDLKLIAPNAKDQKTTIPENFQWNNIQSLSIESLNILEHYKPINIKQLKLIPNLSPAALINVLNYFK